MSIQFPAKRLVSDRKYHEAGVRGRYESNLRIVRGLIQTVAPITIEYGKGFSVVRDGTGLATITFDPPFSALPSFVATIQAGVLVGISIVPGSVTNSAVQVQIFGTDTGTAADSRFQFLAIGSA